MSRKLSPTEIQLEEVEKEVFKLMKSNNDKIKNLHQKIREAINLIGAKKETAESILDDIYEYKQQLPTSRKQVKKS